MSAMTGRWPSRRQMVLLSLVTAAAAALSAVTLIAIGRAESSQARASSGKPSMSQPQLGFVRLDRPAPAVRLPDLAGHGSVSLAGLAGKPIVMNFWASTCEVCKSETPAMARVARTLASKVTFLGVDTLDLRAPAAAFVAKYRVPYQIAFDPAGKAAASYGVPGLPVTVFLSPSGTTILGENIGALTAARLRAILRELYHVT